MLALPMVADTCIFCIKSSEQSSASSLPAFLGQNFLSQLWYLSYRILYLNTTLKITFFLKRLKCLSDVILNTSKAFEANTLHKGPPMWSIEEQTILLNYHLNRESLIIAINLFDYFWKFSFHFVPFQSIGTENGII